MQNTVICTRMISLYVFQPSSVFFSCKTASLGTDLHICKGSSPHLWLLHAKQRHLVPNIKSLWVPDITCSFCMQNSVISIRITSLYGSQPSSMFFACKQRLLEQNYKSLWVPDHTCRFVHAKQLD